MRAPRRPMAVALGWVRRQPPKVKAFLAVVAGMAALVCIRFIVHRSAPLTGGKERGDPVEDGRFVFFFNNSNRFFHL